MASALETMAGEITEKRNRLAGYFAKKAADGTLDITAAERDSMKSLNDELNAIQPKFAKLQEDARAEEANRKALEDLGRPILPAGFHGGQGDPAYNQAMKGHDGFAFGRDGQPVAMLGDLYTASASYKSFAEDRKSGGQAPHEFQSSSAAALKTLFTTTAGWAPFINRQPGAVLSGQQGPKLIDMIPSTEATGNAIKWMLETTYTNNADFVAEAGQYPESAYALTEQLSPIIKIAHFVPVTDEALADEPQVRGYLNGRMELGLRQKFDNQLFTADGTGGTLTGFFTAITQTQAVGTDPVPDAFYKGITKVATVGFAEASGIAMNPTDWQNVRLLRTTQGLYIWGSPDSVGPQRMWGLPVVTSTYCTQGTGLVGDFQTYSQVFYRQGVEFKTSDSHSDFFIKGKLAVRASIRVGFVILRPTAFTKVTGIV